MVATVRMHQSSVGTRSTHGVEINHARLRESLELEQANPGGWLAGRTSWSHDRIAISILLEFLELR